MKEFSLSQAQQKLLLETAREAIRSALEKRAPHWPESAKDLAEKRGAFVTLHRHGSLRGCIGRMTGDEPLYMQIRDIAHAAAFEDPRFPALEKSELEGIQLEISVLSPMTPCSPHDVIPGTHGVYLTNGRRSGVFLPQVATEQGWDREALLENLCRKAGLPPGSHLASDAKLFCFTAFVFGEA